MKLRVPQRRVEHDINKEGKTGSPCVECCCIRYWLRQDCFNPKLKPRPNGNRIYPQMFLTTVKILIILINRTLVYKKEEPFGQIDFFFK